MRGNIYIKFREIQDIPVRVLPGGHDAGGHVRFIHVVADPQQVLLLPDMDTGIRAHPIDQKHVEPVPGKLHTVFLRKPAVTQDGFNGAGAQTKGAAANGGRFFIRIQIMRVLYLLFCVKKKNIFAAEDVLMLK